MKFKAWIKAFRLRTLPLSLSGIILAGFLAYSTNFDWLIFSLAILTTIFLQVLSNLANDYGDFKKGTDNDNRVGPKRAMQAGLISEKEMKTGLIINVILCLLSGVPLVIFALKDLNWLTISFILLGIAGIFASIKYTVGKSAYGYRGLGDVFVFIFFGIVSVCGTFFLLTKEFNTLILLPASAIGLLSTAVLNLNNLRDHINDKASGKETLVVKMGFKNGKKYQALLCFIPVILMGAFGIMTHRYYVFISWIILPVLLVHLRKVFATKEPKLLDPELKKIALTTLLFAVTAGLGFIIE